MNPTTPINNVHTSAGWFLHKIVGDILDKVKYSSKCRDLQRMSRGFWMCSLKVTDFYGRNLFLQVATYIFPNLKSFDLCSGQEILWQELRVRQKIMNAIMDF